MRTEKPEKAEKPEISPPEKAASGLIMTVQVLRRKLYLKKCRRNRY
jgi:hypothetical protein